MHKARLLGGALLGVAVLLGWAVLQARAEQAARSVLGYDIFAGDR